MHSLPVAGKLVTRIKREKTCNQWYARKNTVISAKRRKTFYQSQAQENIHPVQSAGKHKTSMQKRARQAGHGFAHWLKKDNVHSDWFKTLDRELDKNRKTASTTVTQCIVTTSA